MIVQQQKFSIRREFVHKYIEISAQLCLCSMNNKKTDENSQINYFVVFSEIPDQLKINKRGEILLKCDSGVNVYNRFPVLLKSIHIFLY